MDLTDPVLLWCFGILWALGTTGFILFQWKSADTPKLRFQLIGLALVAGWPIAAFAILLSLLSCLQKCKQMIGWMEKGREAERREQAAETERMVASMRAEERWKAAAQARSSLVTEGKNGG